MLLRIEPTASHSNTKIVLLSNECVPSLNSKNLLEFWQYISVIRNFDKMWPGFVKNSASISNGNRRRFHLYI